MTPAIPAFLGMLSDHQLLTAALVCLTTGALTWLAGMVLAVAAGLRGLARLTQRVRAYSAPGRQAGGCP